jgi:hypothetical protein
MGIRNQLCKVLLLVVVVTVLLAPIASADTLNVTGSMTISSSSISFNGPVTAIPVINGVFSSINPGTLGTFSSLSIANQPLGTFSPYTFGAIGGFTLDLTSIYAGSFPSANCLQAGTLTCTPTSSGYLSALNLQNTATGMALSFSGAGTVTGPGIVGSWPFQALFSAQFSGITFQQFLNDIQTQGSKTFGFSALIDATPAATPEPSSLLLLGTGAFSLVGVIRRKLRA